MSRSGELAIRHIKSIELEDASSVASALVDKLQTIRGELREMLQAGQQVTVQDGNGEVIGRVVSMGAINAKIKIGDDEKSVDILKLRRMANPIPLAEHAQTT